jgi:hypothetical protein
MYTTIIFLLLCLAEGGFVYWKWSEIEDYRNLGKDVAIATGVEKNRQYSAFIRIAGRVLGVAKYLLIILVPVLLIVNLIIASILGTILSFIF